MTYRDLDPSQYLDLAQNRIPASRESKWLKEYQREFSDHREGRDLVDLPKSHKGFLKQVSHKGARKLDSTLQDARNWAVLREMWVRVSPEDQSAESLEGASKMREFAQYALDNGRYKGAHDTLAETIDDMLTGFGVRRQNPRESYFRDWKKVDDAVDLSDEDKLVAWAKLPSNELGNLMINDRVDPATFGYIEDADGELAATMEMGTRELGALAQTEGLLEVKDRLGYLDFGTLSGEQLAAAHSTATITTAEIWVQDQGVLLWMDGLTQGSSRAKIGRKLKVEVEIEDRILDSWTNQFGRPPYYIRPITPFPFKSPLDEMMHNVNEFNYWDTLRQVQLHAGVLRTFSLVRKVAAGGVGSPVLDQDKKPQTLTLQSGEPLPYMGEGYEWILSPFEEIDVETGYQNAKMALEESGDLVRALSGSSINQNTAVGTASMMFNSAQRGLSPMIRSESHAVAEELIDLFIWIRDTYKQPVTIRGAKDPDAGESGLQSVTLTIEPKDIVTTNIEVQIRPMMPIDQAADISKAETLISMGLKTLDGVVELGLIPGENDPVKLKDKIFVSKLEGGMEAIDLTVALENYEMRVRGSAPPAPDPNGGVPLTDEFGNPRVSGGNGRAPQNVRDTGLASGDGNIPRQGSVDAVR
jgi:hypothetical protein